MKDAIWLAAWISVGAAGFSAWCTYATWRLREEARVFRNEASSLITIRNETDRAVIFNGAIFGPRP